MDETCSTKEEKRDANKFDNQNLKKNRLKQHISVCQDNNKIYTNDRQCKRH